MSERTKDNLLMALVLVIGIGGCVGLLILIDQSGNAERAECISAGGRIERSHGYNATWRCVGDDLDERE